MKIYKKKILFKKTIIRNDQYLKKRELIVKTGAKRFAEGDVSNHNLPTKNGIFDKSHKKVTICQKFFENVITRGKQCQPLGQGSLGAPFGCKPSLVLYYSIVGHCMSLKNNVSVVKNDVLANCTSHKFLTDHNLANCPIFKNWVICQKFHLAHFLTKMFLTNCTDPVKTCLTITFQSKM